MLPPSTEPQVEPGEVRVAQASQSVPGSDSSGESGNPQIHTSESSPVQDVVKVQLEPPGEIVVYQFVDQHGTLILQVPPQQILDLARQISQELAQEAAPKEPADVEGGKK